MPITEVRHQQNALLILQKAVSAGRIPHAYIFHGPKGVGKKMMADRFAKLLLCNNKIAMTDIPEEYEHLNIEWTDACNKCQSCNMITSGSHPDCHAIHRQLIKYHPDSTVRNRKGSDLGIDVIRHFVIEESVKKPSAGNRKVFIIREAEKLSNSAQNALLKTLEEPPQGTYLIMLTSSIDSLLPTAISRSQPVPFNTLAPEFVTEFLRTFRKDMTEEQIHFFANHESGSVGLAIQLFDDGLFDINNDIAKALLDLKNSDSVSLAQLIEEKAQNLGKTIKDRLKKPVSNIDINDNSNNDVHSVDDYDPDITNLESTRQALTVIFSAMSGFYRDLITINTGSNRPICNMLLQNELQNLAASITTEKAIKAIKEISTTEIKSNYNANTRLCLDGLAASLARLHVC